MEESDVLTNSSGHSSISTEQGEKNGDAESMSCNKHNGEDKAAVIGGILDQKMSVIKVYVETDMIGKYSNYVGLIVGADILEGKNFKTLHALVSSRMTIRGYGLKMKHSYCICNICFPKLANSR